MALLTPPHSPLLSPARHAIASPPLLAAATTPSPLISLSPHSHRHHDAFCANGRQLHRRRRWGVAASVEQEESGGSETTFAAEEDPGPSVSSDAAAEDGVATSAEQAEASPEDLENIRQVKKVLELLKKNRDMTFGEVNEGRIPENRVALQLLAKEMAEWPDLEVEAPKGKSKPGKSVYAKATDTGIDPETAAKRFNLDWDSAADIDGEEDDDDDETEVPSAVGYGALYLLTAFPVIIGISVVLILFYNSLQ
ncbi:unnamed protein product [Urochloa humidicola]